MSVPIILSVLGTRPEAIKMAPVIRVLDADESLDHRLVITAQHRELLDDVLALFELRPAHDLNLMLERQPLHYVASRALSELTDLFAQVQPRFVLVHGDTTTTFIAALAAFYQRIPVGHVEAGLRTSSVQRPFPEELNRRITDLIASHYYCPTAGASRNLQAGREHQGQSFVTGNTALDAVRLVYDNEHKFVDPTLSGFAAHRGPKLLLTAHRRESWGTPLRSICSGLLSALDEHPDAKACFCWHPNPAVREIAGPLLGNHPRITLLDPPRYDTFVHLMKAADLILTDSGGMQEEITLLGRFALVLRDETERPEAVAAGFARVIGTDEEAIRTSIGSVLPGCLSGELPASTSSPFGDGRAADRIHAAVRWALGLETDPPADYVQG